MCYTESVTGWLCSQMPHTKNTYDFHKMGLGSDQLTTARILGAQAICSHEDSSFDRLEGIIGAPMDWHTRVVLLKVRIILCVIIFTTTRYSYLCIITMCLNL